jgi:hypothetical protein
VRHGLGGAGHDRLAAADRARDVVHAEAVETRGSSDRGRDALRRVERLVRKLF